jgi:hypothetical protein
MWALHLQAQSIASTNLRALHLDFGKGDVTKSSESVLLFRVSFTGARRGIVRLVAGISERCEARGEVEAHVWRLGQFRLAGLSAEMKGGREVLTIGLNV